MKLEKLGIPYMGSKRKLASQILQKITQRHHGMTDFYDLFGGGGSISFTAIRDYRFNVHYNELNRHIFSLVEYLKTHKELDLKFYEWVTREQFFEQCGKSNEDADWYSGFVMSCWSFGNNSEKGYMYGKHIEDEKRLAHEFIVNGCLDSMLKLGVDIPELLNINDVQKRRIYFCDYIKANSLMLQYSEIIHLSRITNLTNLQNLQNLQNLRTHNKSYQDVKITGSNPVIYCDIPYKETAIYIKKKGKNVNNYAEIETRTVTNIRLNSKGEPYEYTRRYPVKGQGIQSTFNHDEFYEWFANLDYPAYMSEYDAPFERIEAFGHRSSLSAINNKKKTLESIFWNGKGEITKSTLF